MSSLLLDPTAALAHQHIDDLVDQGRRRQPASTRRAESRRLRAWLAAASQRLHHDAPRTRPVSDAAVCCA